jgi:thioredoxin-related protein
MRTAHLLSSLLLLLALTGAALAQLTTIPEADAPIVPPPGFQSHWAETQRLAQAQHKLIYLHFTTTWCGWCRRIEQDTYPDATVKAAFGDYICASLDCTTNMAPPIPAENKANETLARKYGLTGYPMLVMMTADGDMLGKIDGYVQPAALVTALKDAVALNVEYQGFLTYAATADTTTLDYQVRAYQIYFQCQRGAEALAAAQQVVKLDPEDTSGAVGDASLFLLNNLTPAAWPTEAPGLIAKIRTLDPDNAKGLLEEALGKQINMCRAVAASSATPEERTKQWETVVATATELIGSAKTLQNAQFMHALLGLGEYNLGHYDKAIPAFEKALTFDPKSTLAPQIQALLDQARKKAAV